MNVTRTLTSDQYLVTHSVGPNQQGIRLDNFLKERYRKRSREQLKRAIDSGAVTVRRDQGPHLQLGKLKPSAQLIPGDEVLVLTERKPEPEVCFDYQILFEDESLYVINKPANLPVHPAGRYFFNTLLVHLKTRGYQTPLQSEKEYFLAHRIDKETSGVLVLTKDKESCAQITRQFSERKTRKRYLAIVKGICPEEFTVDLPIKRASHSLIELKMVTAPEVEGGQAALTSFRRLGIYGEGTPQCYSLVECLPKTGRQHQIRVHLEAAGHPIVGDKLYGMPESEALRFYERRHLTPEAEARLILPRHALHASVLEFNHPVSGKAMSFHAPLPSDLKEFLLRFQTSGSNKEASLGGDLPLGDVFNRI
jgi:23S rRNA pseudouridine1911/1915/1917 synthase